MDESQKEYSIERLSAENLHDLSTLYAVVYKKKPASGFFQKKYDTAYTGVMYTGYIAYDKEQHPLAYYGVIPCFVQYAAKIILAAQSADTMTSPRYRYKGLFVELSNKTFALCRASGIKLVFGFPNQNSYHGAVNKLGWKMTEILDCFSIPVNRNVLGWLISRIRFLRKTYLAYTRTVLKKFNIRGDGIKSSVLTDGWAGVGRTKEYLLYKTYNPSQLIRIGDAIIWIRNKSAFCIGDMEAVNENNFLEVIAGLKKIAARLGRKQIQFHASPGTGFHKLFSAHFPSKPSFPSLFQDFGSEIAPGKIKFTYADLDTF